MIKIATTDELSIVQRLVYDTINEIYPNYYPTEVVDFFLNHHREENLLADIKEGHVYILLDNGEYVGTGTICGECMNRVFVLPSYQRRGYGTQLMNFLETQIAATHNSIYLDSSLPAFATYLKRGYRSVEYKTEEIGNGKILCYHVMSKGISERSVSKISLDGKIFTSVSNTDNGEVSEATRFEYSQQGDVIHATYSGGEIVLGFLIGKYIASDKIFFSYQHINKDENIRIGECESHIDRLQDGRLRMNESWQWLNGDKINGYSTIEELFCK